MSSFVETFFVEESKGLDVLHNDLKACAKFFVPEFLPFNEETLNIKELIGGITNLLYRIDSGQTVVIIRIYGKGSELFVNRDIENIIFSKLSESGHGPKYYGSFKNGRVEGFIQATSLTPLQMSSSLYCPGISSCLAEFNCQQVSGISQVVSLWNRIETFFELADTCIKEHIKSDLVKSESLGRLRSRTTEMQQQFIWLRFTLSQFQQKVYDNYQKYQQLIGESQLISETQTIYENRHKLLGQNFAFETVFCHNDLLSGNILVSHADQATNFSTLDTPSNSKSPTNITMNNLQPSSSGDLFDIASLNSDENESPLPIDRNITLIDYEYASYNYRAYDLANHFNEYGGFQFDTNSFPSVESLKTFLRNYVRAVVKYCDDANINNSNTILKSYMENDDDFELFIEGFQVRYLNYLMWCIILVEYLFYIYNDNVINMKFKY